MNQSAVTTYPVTDGVSQALETTLRGVDELLPQADWVQKLARSEATGVPLRIKLVVKSPIRKITWWPRSCSWRILLSTNPARTEVRYNSEWCDKLGARGMIELSAKYTVARMMERNDFHRRGPAPWRPGCSRSRR